MALPARDEAATVDAAVAALADQRDFAGRAFDPERYEVVVLANNCGDDTAAAARAAGAAARRRAPGFRLHVVEAWLAPGEAHSGGARRRAMELAHARVRAARDALGATPAAGVLATTDADTVVAPDWLAATLAEFAAGADAVGGRVVAARLDALPAAARGLYLYDVGYRHLVAAVDALFDPEPHDPWPRHHQHFGASLAVTADAYARVGGMPGVGALEDVRLYEALVRAGLRVRHSPRVRAATSARASGRARVGLATQIAEWAGAGGRWPVESAAFVERWARTRATLRELWAGRLPGELDALAAALCLTPDTLAGAAHVRRPFGAFLLDADLRGRFARAWDARRFGPAHEDVRAAVRGLRSRVAALRGAAR
ncbi:hypothetical protein tb265_23430 [Gemmatimonadetes bacterium T265]|nr:hypothetical protein tb265_23430 [Gemmatimonadetes bacterium T265]